MIRISFQINIDKPRWWARMFRCKHEAVSVTENAFSKYETQTSYKYCLKCGRKAGELEINCKHIEDIFGVCRHCLARLSKFDCEHRWAQDEDTEEYYCAYCGEGK